MITGRWMIELQIEVEPIDQGVTLAEAKQHLRVEFSDDDLLIQSLIIAARQQIEESLVWRSFTPRTYRATFDTWNGSEVWLPMPPVSAVLVVSVVDDGVPAVVVDPGGYVLDSNLGRVRFYGDGVNAGGAAGRLQIDYAAGYDAAPGWAKAAILLQVGNLYENREAVVVGAGVSAIQIPQALEALTLPWRAYPLEQMPRRVR